MTTSLQDLCREAYRLYQSGDRASAAQISRQILEQDPGQSEAIYLLGVLAQDEGRMEDADALLRQAAVLAPGNAVMVNAQGELALQFGRQTEALDCFRRAISARPAYERAHNNVGRVLHTQGDLAGAEACFTQAIRLNPQYATAHNNLGAVMQAQGKLKQAAAHFQQALTLRPDYPEAHFNLGTALQTLGDPLAAGARFQQAIRIRPNYVRAIFHLGQVLESLRQDRDALACYESAARLQPDDADIQRRLGDLLLLKKDWPAALAALERAVQLKPEQPEPFARLAYARQQVCEWRTYDADSDRLWRDAEKQLAQGDSTALVPFQALTLPWDSARLLAIARSHSSAVARHQRERGQSVPYSFPRTKTGRLKVGYLSGDFYDHAISHLLHGMFARHDRGQVEVFAYSFGPADDSAYRARIRAGCEHFVEVAPLSIPALAQRIHDDGVHILVDLMGHTGVNRLGALALRPAPIQVSFLGMLGTMGADYIDYLIADRFVTPPESVAAFTEKFALMPHSYLIAEPEAALPEAPGRRADHGLPEDGIVFCSFNNMYKIEPRTFGAWMHILASVPGSVLWLYSTGQLIEDNLRREAAARGVDGRRLVFGPFLPWREHLVRQRLADLFLDTLLYNGAATTSMALQAGLPVLTCLGNTFASRVGASLLNAIGMPELVATNLEEYQQLAIALAQQPDQLRQRREKLSHNRIEAPLFDTPRFVRNLERAYHLMWDVHASGQAPEAITVVETEAHGPQAHKPGR